jgi:16S rRNA (uracil1498-N3)-methyltransferase
MATVNSSSTSSTPSSRRNAEISPPGQGMEYFFAPPAAVSGRRVVLQDDEFVHLTHVMRKKLGDAIIVVDGIGHAHRCQIQKIDRHTAVCDIEESYERLHEATLHLVAAVALLKHPASMDYMIEKLTEVGVSIILPLHTLRTIPQHVRTARWQKIALSAMKQAGRCILPSIEPLSSYSAFLEMSKDFTWKCIPHEGVLEPHLRDVSPPAEGRAVLCIGPEGGFTEEEVEAAVTAGFLPVSLGSRRLRAETAAVVTAAMLLQ